MGKPRRENSPTTKARNRAKRGTSDKSSAESHWQGIETRGSAYAYKSLRKAGAGKKAAAMIASKHKNPTEALKKYKKK